jgi:hypothetical protein
MAVAIASGMSEAQAEEVALANIERMVENESYYRQKNVIVRYGQAGYYTKDSNSKVARWTAFAVDFFNPVDDVITITDLLEDAPKFAARTGIKVIYVVGDKVEKVLLNYFDNAGSGKTTLWHYPESVTFLGANVWKPPIFRVSRASMAAMLAHPMGELAFTPEKMRFTRENTGKSRSSAYKTSRIQDYGKEGGQYRPGQWSVNGKTMRDILAGLE